MHRRLLPRMPHPPRRCCAVVAATALLWSSIAGCSGPARNPERVGLTGAAVAVSGLGLQVAGGQWIEPRQPVAGGIVRGTGGLMFVGGVLAAVYALDAAMRQGGPAPYDPTPAASPRVGACLGWQCPAPPPLGRRVHR